MDTNIQQTRLQHAVAILQYAAFVAALVAVKLWLIKTYANETPSWDPWDAEAAGLYDPILKGQVTWAQFFAPHNEHRIFTTRLLDLLLLWANELWSPRLQMIANAAFHIAALGALVRFLTCAIGRGFLPAMLLFTLVVSAVPFAWENTLTGFQAQFYFVLLLSTLSIWYLLQSEPLSRRWWVGFACAVLAFLSFASGALASAAAGAMLGLRWVLLGRRRKDGWATLLILALFCACVVLTPTIGHHSSLKAKNLHQLLVALTEGFAWPGNSASSAVIRNIPWLLMCLWLVVRRIPWDDPRWFIAAMGVWVSGQTFALAFGRTDGVLTPRYLDLHVIFLFVNFAALGVGVAAAQAKMRLVVAVASAAWLAIVLGPLAGLVQRNIPAELASKRDGEIRQEVNLRAYLETGDEAAIKALPSSHIPYPNAERLVDVLRSPEIRAILPRNLQPALKAQTVKTASGHGFAPGGVYPTTPECRCNAWGSYLAAYGGDGSVGVTEIHYQAPQSWSKAPTMQMQIAGYPSKAGRIEVVQGSKVSQVQVGRDPGEGWKLAYFRVERGPFVVRLVDTSPASWFAASEPTVAGRMAPLVDRLLDQSLRFLAASAALACLSLVLTLWFAAPALAWSPGVQRQENSS